MYDMANLTHVTQLCNTFDTSTFMNYTIYFPHYTSVCVAAREGILNIKDRHNFKLIKEQNLLMSFM